MILDANFKREFWNATLGLDNTTYQCSHCPAACEVEQFHTQLTYAAISPLSLDSLLKKYGSILEDDYVQVGTKL